ncbi:DUF397 domain-containing protein [Streptomyces sp. NPDC058457]|uniref:DUF397 domain-containing protein n=1 Tax=Streptomyces sp. NPDC058457 TaxID=3346507 RepID=UPI00364A40F6
MTRTPDLSNAMWCKSSYSDGGDNNCVEIAFGHPGTVPVRDSKLPVACPLVFSAASWSGFVAGVKGEADWRTFG